MSNFQGIRAAMRLMAAAGLSLLVAFGASAQTVRYIHTDGLGSPVVVTDKDRNVIERSEYEPYGELLNRPITDGPGYTGHAMDSTTGLTYMQQRYYDQSVGLFLSVDPVKVDIKKVNFNRYVYAAANPYKFTDPDGRTIKGAESCTNSSVCRFAFSGKNWSNTGNKDAGSGYQRGPYKDGYKMPLYTPSYEAPFDPGEGHFQLTTIFDKVVIDASAITAMGMGLSASKGVVNSQDKVGGCLMCIGTSVSADVTVAKLSYVYPNLPVDSKTLGLGFGIDAHGIWGVSIDLDFESNGPSLTLKTGPGLGASFKGVNPEIQLDQ